MTAPSSDALVFFGATGDLAYRKIFPALQAMIRHGDLDIPIIGMARGGWTLDRLRDRVRDSLEQNGGVDANTFAKLSAQLKYVDSDYGDPATYERLKQALGRASRRSVPSHPMNGTSTGKEAAGTASACPSGDKRHGQRSA